MGAVHARRRVEPASRATLQREYASLVRERMRSAHYRLAERLPSPDDVERLLAGDPTNTNLLFLRAARILVEDAPDWVLITGDLTDDGVGYDLVLAALAPFVARGRLLAVPGNHDVYDSPRFVVPAHARRRRADKLADWHAFAAQLGLPASPYWLRELGEGAIVCGLDSCNPALTPMSASGAILPQTLQALHAALEAAPPGRIAMLHHHVVNPPVRAVGAVPWQLGLRLRNARAVYDTLRALQFRCVLNGHRHVGYRYHPSHAPMFVSAPSATLGCRSGASPRPFYWRIELARRRGWQCARVLAVTLRLVELTDRAARFAESQGGSALRRGERGCRRGRRSAEQRGDLRLAHRREVLIPLSNAL